MPERSNGAVSKTVVRASVPWVRIPLPPPPYAFRLRAATGSEVEPDVYTARIQNYKKLHAQVAQGKISPQQYKYFPEVYGKVG